MKSNKIKHLKLLGLVIVLGTFELVQAQNTTSEITKQAEVNYAAAGLSVNESIRLIDNKGTIKFLQTANGLTTLTNTSGTNVTTTTIQLGGTLTDDSYIDVAGNVFGLNGIPLVDTTTESASTDASTESDAGTGTGYTILVRDEATGATKKLLASAITTSAGVEHFDATASQTMYTLTDASVVLDIAKTQVYRNGVKLLATEDYTVAANVVTLITGVTYDFFTADVIEVHYLN